MVWLVSHAADSRRSEIVDARLPRPLARELTGACLFEEGVCMANPAILSFCQSGHD